jgi:hypothetical protein
MEASDCAPSKVQTLAHPLAQWALGDVDFFLLFFWDNAPFDPTWLVPTSSLHHITNVFWGIDGCRMGVFSFFSLLPFSFLWLA